MMNEQEVKEIMKLIWQLQPQVLFGLYFYELLPEEWEALIQGEG